MSASSRVRNGDAAPPRAGREPSRRVALRPARAFTLIELLVVMAVTSILLLVLFVPLSKSIELVTRANAKIEGQDDVRKAIQRIVHDLGNAMEVYESRPINMYGFDKWTFNNTKKVGIPANGAVPTPFLVNNAVLSFRLPRHRFFCTKFDHYVTQTDMDAAFGPNTPYDLVALDNCPRHPGSPVEFRPQEPREPDNKIVAYFVALKDGTIRFPNWKVAVTPNDTRTPFYRNLMLFGVRGLADLDDNMVNTYALYRVEFTPDDPSDPNPTHHKYANWNLANGAPNPNFFYDTAPDTAGVPYCRNWQAAAVSLMNSETGDVAKWLETNGLYLPHPLCTGGPAPVDAEVANPNQSPGTLGLNGGASAGQLPPLDYILDHGGWTGLADDGTGVIQPGMLLAPQAPAGSGVTAGPRIEVFQQGPGALASVFDSGGPTRNRLVAYNSVTGRVSLAVPRSDAAGNVSTREYYSADLTGYYQADLKSDTKVANGLPTSFGAAIADARFSANSFLVPGSEVVKLVNSSTGTSDILRRAGWTGLGAANNRLVAQSDLGPNDYTIDYRTGVLTFSDRDPSQWSGVGTSGATQLYVKYSFEVNGWYPGDSYTDSNNNGQYDSGEPFVDDNGNGQYDPPRPADVVRASYVTRELALVNLGIVKYTRRLQEMLPFEVSERVAVRNLKK